MHPTIQASLACLHASLSCLSASLRNLVRTGLNCHWHARHNSRFTGLPACLVFVVVSFANSDNHNCHCRALEAEVVHYEFVSYRLESFVMLVTLFLST